MKRVETKEMKEITTVQYVAEDGRVFANASDCDKYERNMQSFKRTDFLITETSKFRINAAEDYRPFNGGENHDHNVWFWFKVENRNQLNLLNELYGTRINVSLFPEFICMEYQDENYFPATLSDSMRYVEELCSKLGVTVEFKIGENHDN